MAPTLALLNRLRAIVSSRFARCSMLRVYRTTYDDAIVDVQQRGPHLPFVQFLLLSEHCTAGVGPYHAVWNQIVKALARSKLPYCCCTLDTGNYSLTPPLPNMAWIHRLRRWYPTAPRTIPESLKSLPLVYMTLVKAIAHTASHQAHLR